MCHHSATKIFLIFSRKSKPFTFVKTKVQYRKDSKLMETQEKNLMLKALVDRGISQGKLNSTEIDAVLIEADVDMEEMDAKQATLGLASGAPARNAGARETWTLPPSLPQGLSIGVRGAENPESPNGEKCRALCK